MKNRKIKKKPLIFLSIFLLILTVGSTYAYYYTHYAIENNFNTADYNIVLEEYFPSDVWDNDLNLDKKVTITNSGDADVFLRISFSETWYQEKNDEKEILNNMYNGQYIVQKNWNSEFNDFVEKDGWYYYTKVLNIGDTVAILDSITKVINIYNDESIKYELDFNYEVLQVEAYATKRVWGIDSSVDGDNVTWDF